MRHRLRSIIAGTVAVFVLAGAAALLLRDARALGLDRLHAAWSGVPTAARWWCAVLTAASFACLGAIERLAVRRVLGGRISAGRVVAVGTVAHGLANTLGFHAFVAPGVRLLLYRAAQPGAKEIARVLALVAGALVAGVAGCAVLAAAAYLGGPFAAAVAAVASAAWIALVHFRARPASALMGLLPSPAMLLLGLAESAAAMAALYVLLPTVPGLSAARFVLAFAASAALGVVSHAPGGIGVFEASMLAALPGDPAAVLGALLWFRVIYNLAPFALAAPAFGTLQLWTGNPALVGRRIQSDSALLPQVEPGELA